MAYAENASSWVGTLADARGRGYRSGQGLHRGDTVGSGRWREHRTPEGEDIGPGKDSVVGIQLGFREMAKSIAAGPELACGSDS